MNNNKITTQYRSLDELNKTLDTKILNEEILTNELNNKLIDSDKIINNNKILKSELQFVENECSKNLHDQQKL